jgi:hypothetical protein
MPIDTSNPLITTTYSERTEPTSIGMNWVTASQLSDTNSGLILERNFSNLENITPVQLLLGSGSPPGNPDSYSFHYRVRNKVNEHNYQGFESFTDDVESSYFAFNNFFGWKYLVNQFYRTQYFTDTLLFSCVWRIYSLPSIGGTATDHIQIYSPAGTLISDVGRAATGDNAINLNLSTGISTGIRTTSSTTTTFKTRLGSSVINTFNQNDTHGTPNSTLLIYSPILNYGDNININYPTARPVIYDVGTGLPVSQIIHNITVFFYGSFWTQELNLNNIFQQGWLTHPPGTIYSTRLKPPGLSALSDNYNNDTLTTINTNTSFNSINTIGSIYS